MKSHASIVWSVTLLLISYLLVPKVSAAVPNPTNYWPQAVSVEKAKIVKEVDERAPTQPTQPPESKVLAPIIFFAIVLAVFAYIIWQLIKLLDKVIPPTNPPDPPPGDVNTNYPPITINPTHGPGIATAHFQGKSLTVTSNTPSWGTIQCYDISELNYTNKMEKFNVPVVYDRYWSVSMMTSTNGIDWKDSHYRVDCYFNVECGAVQYAYYHYGTNWWNCYYTTSFILTNHVAPAWIDLSDGPRELNQFFKIAPK
jgi:hypothetical protein